MNMRISNNGATKAIDVIHNELGGRVLICTLRVCKLFEAQGEDYDARAQLLQECGVSEAEMKCAQSIIMEHVDGGVIDG